MASDFPFLKCTTPNCTHTMTYDNDLESLVWCMKNAADPRRSYTVIEDVVICTICNKAMTPLTFEQFNPVPQASIEELGSALNQLIQAWENLGIDPDDFLKCAYCHKLMFDPDDHFKAVQHCNGKPN